MKKLLALLSSLTLIIGNVAGQTVLTLQPDSTDGKDAQIHDLFLVWGGAGQHFVTSAWTWQNNPGVQRSLVDFDLGTIPISSTVSSAYLSLWGKVNPPDQHSTLSGSNACWLQRITSIWDENTVDWGIQPTTVTLNGALLPQSTTPDQDYLDIDVTAMVQDMVNDPANSHGFMIKLQNEAEYRMMTFCTSEHTDFSKHPKLVITYIPSVGISETENNNYIEIYPNPTTGKFTVQGATGEIQVHDLFGRLVLSSTKPQINMSGFAKGIYVWRVGEARGKVLVE